MTNALHGKFRPESLEGLIEGLYDDLGDQISSANTIATAANDPGNVPVLAKHGKKM